MIDKEKIVLYGSGGLGRGIVDLIKKINDQSYTWDLLGFVDDQEEKDEVNGLKVLGGINFLNNYEEKLNVVLAFGDPKVKKAIYDKLSNKTNIHFPNLIHPGVDNSLYNEIGKGNVISKGVALSTNLTLGNFNLIHYNCSIGHDVLMGDFNSIFPLTAISGYVSLENEIEIGTNSALIPNLLVQDKAIIGAGSTVLKDVRGDTTVAGVPAKEL